ncbi:MAG TPA: PilZ domain-containing protein [Pyrinomonadaceae bacterium]|nr:PilZ domain-containing protein [Pyrinomonadaceae bacterium]
MQERRQATRFRLNLKARWESLLAQGRGAVCDLSATGCFLLAPTKLNAGELVRLEIQFPDHLVFAWGQTVYQVAEMGFAVRFVFSEENEARALRRLIEKLQPE